MPRNRFSDALFIQQGACNPSGIALTLHEACKQCIADGTDQRTDPAVRLITHQLAYLMNVQELDTSLTEYANLSKACNERSDA